MKVSGKTITKMDKESILTNKQERNMMVIGNKGKKTAQENLHFKVGTFTKVDFKMGTNKVKELFCLKVVQNSMVIGIRIKQ